MVVEVLDVGDPTRVGLKFTFGDTRKATSSCWAKVVTEIDKSQQNGYAFVGEFIKPGAVVDIGSYVVLVRGEGSWKHPHSHIYLYRITKDGAEELYNGSWNTKADKVKAINEMAKIVNSSSVDSEKARALARELVELVGTEALKLVLEELRGAGVETEIKSVFQFIEV